MPLNDSRVDYIAINFFTFQAANCLFKSTRNYKESVLPYFKFVPTLNA